MTRPRKIFYWVARDIFRPLLARVQTTGSDVESSSGIATTINSCLVDLQ